MMLAFCPLAGTNANVVVETAPEITASFAYGEVVAPIPTRKVVVDCVID